MTKANKVFYKKVDKIMKKTKRLQKMAHDQYKDIVWEWKKIKRESIVETDMRICPKKRTWIKEYGKNTDKLYLKKIKKTKSSWKNGKNNYSNNLLKK